MTILSAILLAAIILFVLKALVVIIEYAGLWDALFYAIVIILIALIILILTAPSNTFTQ